MGEDIEFSIRIINSGFKTGLIPTAFVYHKRRTNLRQFYRQLHFFGRARINVQRFFADELKAVHLLPAAFTLGFLLLWLTPFVSLPLFYTGTGLLFFYFLLIGADATRKYKSLRIGTLSVGAAFVQLFAYGIGFFLRS